MTRRARRLALASVLGALALAPSRRADAQVFVRPWVYHPVVVSPVGVPPAIVPPVVLPPVEVLPPRPVVVYRPWLRPRFYHPWVYRPWVRRW